MTRKTISVFFVLLFISFNLMAAHVAIAPETGAYGVNMASNKYRGNEHSGNNFSWIKGTGESDNPTFDQLTGVQSKQWYLDQHIIGLGGVYDLESSQKNSNTRYTVTAYCANGFNFKSQSNPNIVRPFEILIVARYGDNKTDRIEVLKDSGQSETFNYIVDENKDNGMHLWFDLVLALPLDVDPVPGSTYIKANGQTYSLVQENDYTALVTINVTAWDANGVIGTDSISIPFSGYFNGQTEGKGDDRLSLMFTPNANAGNLNIQTQHSLPIPVGNIDFMLDADYTKHERPWEDEKYKDGYVKIFFSSRNEPDDANAQPFRFVHSSVGDSDPLTNYNSIGYEIVVSGSNSSTSFSGDDHLVNGDVENAIIPEKVTSNTSHQGAREFFEYSGTINVIIDEPTTIMQEGDYHDTVYVHVVTDSDKAGI